MRSWFTAMPGEVLSCIGCHEKPNTAPPQQRAALAASRPPEAIRPWYGPARGFDFRREVQPVLDRHCLGCHDGRRAAAGAEAAAFVRARSDGSAGRADAAESERVQFGLAIHAVVLCPAQVGPHADPGERHAPVAAMGVPRRHDPTGADAPEGALRRTTRRRRLGPAGHVDRSERAGPWHVDRHLRRVTRARSAAAAARAAPTLHRHGRRPGSDRRGVPGTGDAAGRDTALLVTGWHVPECNEGRGAWRGDVSSHALRCTQGRATLSQGRATLPHETWPRFAFNSAGRWHRVGPGANSGGAIRHGSGRRLPGRAAAVPGVDRSAVLAGPRRGHERAVRPVRSGPRQRFGER